MFKVHVGTSIHSFRACKYQQIILCHSLSKCPIRRPTLNIPYICSSSRIAKSFHGVGKSVREDDYVPQRIRPMPTPAPRPPVFSGILSVLNLLFNAQREKALRSGNPDLLQCLFYIMGKYPPKQMLKTVFFSFLLLF